MRVRHRQSGVATTVDRFAHDGTTDFFVENGSGPYKQVDFERIAGRPRAFSWDD